MSALTVYFPSIFRGSYTSAPTAVLSSILNLVGLVALGPASITTGTESRNPGTVIFPNTTGQVARGNVNRLNAGSSSFGQPGQYDFCTVKGSSTVNITVSGIYHITGDLLIQSSSAALNVNDGVSAVLIVDGNVNVLKTIGLNTSGVLALYCNGAVNIVGGTVNGSGGTSRLTIFGSSTCNAITLSSNAIVVGAVYAPRPR